MEKTEAFIKDIVFEVLAKSGITVEDSLEVPLGISNRHIHLTKEHVELLFGAGYELTPMKPLMGKEFASKETVTIIGPSMRAIENVRVLGPTRVQTQVEISRTDTFVLKVKAPVRPSGEITASAGITIVGTKGTLVIKEGCIIANRHIHMAVADAEKFGLKDGDYVDVESTVKTDRRTKFYDVQIRVSDNYHLEMHIDTDDANSAGLSNSSKMKVV